MPSSDERTFTMLSATPTSLEVVAAEAPEQLMLPLQWTPQQRAIYEETYLEPVRELKDTLADVLNVEAHPERTPADALSLVHQAMQDFVVKSDGWIKGSGAAPER